MKKKLNQCIKCTHWRYVVGTDFAVFDWGNCKKIIVGKDVRVSGYYLQTSFDFYCKYFEEKKEVKDDAIDSDGTCD
jgi:hypothetical protein